MSDPLFDIELKPLKPRKGRAVPIPPSRLIIGSKATVARTIRRLPEVVIKIASNAKDRHAINNIVDYIARLTPENKRNGIEPVVIEDEQGNTFVGEYARTDALHGWNSMPATGGTRREAFHVVFSMPVATDRRAVTEAVRRFVAEEYRNHQYLFATHDENDRPHVHVIVNASPYRGKKRLNPRKADLQRWREVFAENLRALGVEANATPRIARGVTERYASKAVREIRERGGVQTKAEFVQGHREPTGVVVTVESGSTKREVEALAGEILKQGRVEDQHGRPVAAADQNKALVDLWPEESKQRALFVTFGVREQADLETQRAAVIELAAERLANHRYLVGVDQERNQVGVLINAKPTFGADLQLRLGAIDLQRWREAYSVKLKGHGIEADAIASPTKSTLAKLDRVRVQVLSEYGAMAKELSKGSAEDKALAVEITKYVQSMGMVDQVPGRAPELQPESQNQLNQAPER